MVGPARNGQAAQNRGSCHDPEIMASVARPGGSCHPVAPSRPRPRPRSSRTPRLENGESAIQPTLAAAPEPLWNGAGKAPSQLNHEVMMHATQVRDTNYGHEISPGISRQAMIVYRHPQESDTQPILCTSNDRGPNWPRASRRGGECQCLSVLPFAAVGWAAS